MNHHHKLWVDRYRPTTIDDYIFHDETHERAFRAMIENKTIPHLLLSGIQGSGKTTLSNILVIALDIDPTDVLIINASDENSVDTIREKIKAFITTFAMGEFKVVRLEEADYITQQGQGILRMLMEEFSDNARFILTCNYENKIIPAIKSRVQQFRFKASNHDDVTEYAASVLISEHVKFQIHLLDLYVSAGYPDVRKIVNMLQQNTIGGQLQSISVEREAEDYKFKLLELLERDRWEDARTLACENVPAEEWEEVYSFLMHNLHKSPRFQDKDAHDSGILIIVRHLYQHASFADPALNAWSMFIELSRQGK